MRIDATNDSYAQGARFPVSGSAASYSDAMSTVMANDPGQLDFTNMTRQELMDWANGQFFSGKITTDELLSFMRMSIHGMRLHDENAPDDTRYNYMQLARGGIEGALWLKDEAMLKWLESTLQIMRKTMREVDA